MGEVISLAQRREERRRGELVRSGRPRAVFYFDLASPFTYLAAERVDRLFPGVEWRPAFLDAVCAGDPLSDAGIRERLASAAHARADELHMPLVWPERYPAAGRAAMRVAALAAQEGRAAPFVLAASRLAFCGGFDLDDPETLAEAAAAACLGR
jgi:2-hydroxychromene-2-carboxylate isomerase